jgi:hypothetical protein
MSRFAEWVSRNFWALFVVVGMVAAIAQTYGYPSWMVWGPPVALAVVTWSTITIDVITDWVKGRKTA